MTTLAILVLFLILGAKAARQTFLHVFALAFDAFAQDVLWQDDLGVTISARCGLLQRRGHVWPARVVNLCMGSPTHCADSIGWDIERLNAGLKLLEGTGG